MRGLLRCGFIVCATVALLFGADPPAKPQDALFGSLPVVEAAALHSPRSAN